MKTINFLLASFFLIITLTSCGGNADTVKVKEIAPNFSLPDSEGNLFTLSDYKGKSPVVIYFYPKASTPGCTTQACGIRDEYEKFSQNNITVLGISVDSKASIKEFMKDNSLNFPLLSDEEKKTSEAYGVLNNFGLANRITFIIDKNGNIANIIKDVDVDTHADDVFEIASKL